MGRKPLEADESKYEGRIGANFRRLRVRKFPDQETFAAALCANGLEVSQQAVSQWELGKRFPKLPDLLIIATTLGCSPSSLIPTEIVFEKNTILLYFLLIYLHEYVVYTVLGVNDNQTLGSNKMNEQTQLEIIWELFSASPLTSAVVVLTGLPLAAACLAWKLLPGLMIADVVRCLFG